MDEGNKRAALVAKIIDDSGKLLSAVLIGNNIVNISCSALVTTFTIKVWGSFATGICCVLPDNASLFSGPHLPQDLPSCQTIAQKRSGRRKVSGSSEAGTVTERTGAAELPENERI